MSTVMSDAVADVLAKSEGDGDSLVALVPDPASIEQLNSAGVYGDPVVVLRYLGSSSSFTQVMMDWIANTVVGAIADQPHLSTDVVPVTDGPETVALVDPSALGDLRQCVLTALPIDQLPEDSERDPAEPQDGTDPIPVMFDRVRVMFGTQYTDIPLDSTQPVAKSQFTIAKSDTAKQYTLSPWYVPNVMDAHDEWTDPDSLQEAVWNYVKTNDRTMRLQHNPDTAVGEWVEIMSWPFEVTVPQIDPDTQTAIDVTYPAGTVFLGCIWNDTGWSLVTSGQARGLSIGGYSLRLMTDDNPDSQQTD